MNRKQRRAAEALKNKETNPPQILPPRLLGGEADQKRYAFINHENGRKVEGNETIVPIVKQVDGWRLELIGTGFFIASNGILVTAKHVLKDVMRNGQQVHGIAIVQFIPGNQYLIRPLMFMSENTNADIAIAVPQSAKHNITGEELVCPRATLTTETPAIGDIVSTYAYPNSSIENNAGKVIARFEAHFYEGCLDEFLPEGRDRVMLPSPCFRTSFVTHGGASGGPVVGPSGKVFAVNSTGWHGEPLSFVSRINEILPLTVNIKDEKSGTVQAMTVIEMAKRGWVAFDPPLNI